MDNQQHRARSGSYGVPPLFTRNKAVLSEDYKRIIENKRGRFEREAVVLPLVDPGSFPHPSRTALLYKMYNTSRGFNLSSDAVQPSISSNHEEDF
jgi:hypothetical protein